MRIIISPAKQMRADTDTFTCTEVPAFMSIGMRICGAAELARLARMRSGISISENFVSAKEEAAIAADAINGEPYFGKTSCSDIQEIAAAIRVNSVRHQCRHPVFQPI